MGSTRQNIRGLFSDLLELTEENGDLKPDEVEIHLFIDDSRRLTIPQVGSYGDLVDLTGRLAAGWEVAQSDIQMKCNRKGQTAS